MRRRDVVAVGGEDNERVLDAAKINGAVLVEFDLAFLEPIANEQVFDSRNNLLTTQPIEATPPPLEIEKAVGFGVNFGEQICVFFEQRVTWFEVLEVLHEPGTVEAALV